MGLVDASAIGAERADCDVCGIDTYYRHIVGDGHVPICSDGCRRAWPRMQALRAEVRGARNEAAVVRRAYLHERWRADAACGELTKHDRAKAEEIALNVYRGSAEPCASVSESTGEEG